MAARINGVLSSQRIYGKFSNGDRDYLIMIVFTNTEPESIWHAPPTFLAPCLKSFFSTTPPLTKTRRQVKRYNNRDAYALRQAKARKDANLSRQAVLKEQRTKELGDPIRGIESPFVKSFDDAIPKEASNDIEATSLSGHGVKAKLNKPPPSPASGTKENHFDHGITPTELEKSLEYSRRLTEPLPPGLSVLHSEAAERERLIWAARNRSASEAVQRIVSLANASNVHRTKKNIERIIETFGRHHTDETLKPKAAAVVTRNPSAPAIEPTPRAGPDTGSSEVQIGILTAKIRVLADRYEGENRNDKINKRNLRLLLHRRQKLLKYMEKKERGSERWQNMIQTLGLTPATWQGQIAIE